MKVIVIGGGPAGMIAAITASKCGNNVTLFEKMRSVGRKLSITGKGRCNITNAMEMSEFMSNIPGNPKFLYSAFNEFSNQDVINFFNEIGVETKVERGGRVFPKSDNAMEVVDKLKKAMDKSNVKVLVNKSVSKIVAKEGKIVGVIADEFYEADKVIICDRSSFTFLHSIIQMFSRSFLLSCSLFDILTPQGENRYFHIDRASYRNSDHRGSCRYAAARFRHGEGKSQAGELCRKCENESSDTGNVHNGL